MRGMVLAGYSMQPPWYNPHRPSEAAAPSAPAELNTSAPKQGDEKRQEATAGKGQSRGAKKPLSGLLSECMTP